MSAPLATVLIVDDDPLVRSFARAVLAGEGEFRIEVAADGSEALGLARELRPDLVVSDYAMPGLDGVELCTALRADPALAGTLFVVLSGVTDPELKRTGLARGVDDFLAKPVEAPALVAKVRAMVRLKRLHDALRSDHAEVQRLHGELAQSFDQLLALLVHLMDLAMPGAADRGERLAEAARRLAARFEVPGELVPDLELAARLHEIGAVVEPGSEPWRHAVASRAVLRQVPRLRPAADLIGAMHEHWDGTGLPAPLMAGQIPLRARMLRVLVDFHAALDAARGAAAEPAGLAAALAAHAGTWYDPAVVAQLEAMLRAEPAGAPAGSRRRVAIEALEPGMVLAEDLCTNTGLKLLGRGATIGLGTLDIIRHRHAGDPILAGAWIEQPAGG
jgi:response regulator RpfG family c-di-GMP phosphodiesterase